MISAIKKITAFGIFAIVSIAVFGQDFSGLPVTEVNGKRYYSYTVKPKETVYSLCRRFGVSREDFMRYNPSAADGLKIDQVLLFPCEMALSDPEQAKSTVSQQETRHELKVVFPTEPAPAGAVAYTVQPKETAYSISRRFGMTLDEFYALNPDTRDGNLKSDEQVWVRQTVQQPAEKASAAEHFYVVKPGDTFYSISRAHGLGVDELQAANKDVSVLVPGQHIVLPQGCDEKQPEPDAETVEQPKAMPVSTVASNEADGITIAVALPFMLEQESKPKQAALFTEFYKGFLLAVDSMRNCGKPIRILTYDTKGTDAGIEELIADKDLASAQVIIGPDNAAHVERLGRYGLEHAASVFNIFAVKDESYKELPNVMNSIVPHSMMYDKAVAYFVDKAPDYTPVILKRNDGQQDKAEFIARLKKLLAATGREYVEIEFDKKLSEDDLAQLTPDNRYAFIPESSKLSELKAVLPALSEFAQHFSVPENFRLWGYPEWLSFRGEPLQAMHKLNTTIFSRFYNTGTYGPDAERISGLFTRWYGGKMTNVIPNQGLYGFDTGMYLIKALLVNGGDFNHYTPVYDGVQNCFSFVRTDGRGGMVNNEMFIIVFRPDETVTKLSL